MLAMGLTGSNRDRPGLREALAACREGGTLVVTWLDRLARSSRSAREILDDLTKRHGDLSVVYPLARGTGPLLSATAAIAFLGERPSPLGIAGAALIVAAVFSLIAPPVSQNRHAAPVPSSSRC